MPHGEVLSQDEERPTLYEGLHAQPEERPLDRVQDWIESRRRRQESASVNPTGFVAESQVHQVVERVPWYESRIGCVTCKQTLALQTDLFEIAWTAYFDASLLKTSYSVRVHKYWPEAPFREFPIWENNVWTHHYVILMDLLEQ